MDTSAVIAIIRDEPDRAMIEAALVRTDEAVMSAATLVEMAIVTDGRAGSAAWPDVEALMDHCRIRIIPFTAEHAALAREGWRRFGKGRHKAGLNLGDCFAYALAKSRNQPLLFKGDDFAQTDVKAAI